MPRCPSDYWEEHEASQEGPEFIVYAPGVKALTAEHLTTHESETDALNAIQSALADPLCAPYELNLDPDFVFVHVHSGHDLLGEQIKKLSVDDDFLEHLQERNLLVWSDSVYSSDGMDEGIKILQVTCTAEDLRKMLALRYDE